VDKDVAVDGVTLIRAGAPVTGVIAKVNRGSYERNRDGYLDLRLSEPAGERPIVVRLGGIPPEPVYHVAADNPPNTYFDQFLRSFQIAAAVVGVFLLLIFVVALI
jgi:hypothetical protein